MQCNSKSATGYLLLMLNALKSLIRSLRITKNLSLQRAREAIMKNQQQV